MAELQVAVVGDLDHALVPAVGALHRLVHRQRIEELVGEDDRRSFRHVAERSVPMHRHVDAGQRLPLALLAAPG